MGRTTAEIEREIERKREDLRSNLQELETRVKSVTDWRRHYRNSPGIALGFAFGSGLLLAALLGGSRSSRRGQWYAHARPGTFSAPRSPPDLRLWDTMQSALIGLAASKIAETLWSAVPKFSQHLADVAHPASRADAVRSGDGVQGEGDYRAAARYRSAAERFAHEEDVERAAREAAPKSEAEAEELAVAEARGRSRTSSS